MESSRNRKEKKEEVNPFIEGVYQAGKRFHKGINAPVSAKEAIRHYKFAAEKGHALSQFSLGYGLLYGFALHQDLDLKNLTGFTRRKHDEPIAKKEEREEAFHWLSKAAAQDHIEAKYYVALCHQNGWGTGKNEPLAFKIYSELHDSFVDAKIALANCYGFGIGVERNIKLAHELLFSAASGDGDEDYSDRAVKALQGFEEIFPESEIKDFSHQPENQHSFFLSKEKIKPYSLSTPICSTEDREKRRLT